MARTTPTPGGDLTPDAKTLRLLDIGTEIEANHPANTGDLGFTHPLITLISMPMKDPGDVPMWETRNGSVVFTLRPSIVRGPDGNVVDSGFTYGMTPRRVMLYLMSEAVRTQSPTVALGGSLRSFLKSLGAPIGGKTVDITTRHVRRLLASPITLEDFRRDSAGRQQISGSNLSMAESYRFTFSEDDQSGIGVSDNVTDVLDSWITLSDPFFKALANSPAPVDLRAIAAMGSSPLKFDIMAWASYRLPTLSGPLHVTWEDLFQQFGLTDAAPRQAKARFRAALSDVRAVYGAARIEETETGMRMWPSRPLTQKKAPTLRAAKAKHKHGKPSGVLEESGQAPLDLSGVDPESAPGVAGNADMVRDEIRKAREAKKRDAEGG